MTNETLHEISEAFVEATQSSKYWKDHPTARPSDFERVLRVDTLINEGEGRTSGIKVQIRLTDTTGIKPYRILDVEVDRLSGSISLMRRSDQPEGGSMFHVTSLHDDVDARFYRLLLRATIALLKQDGYPVEATLLEELLERGQGIGLRSFDVRWAKQLKQSYEQAPEYRNSYLIHRNGLIPGKYYVVGEIPPAGFLQLTIVQFGRLSELSTNVQEESWIHDRRSEGQMLQIRLDLKTADHAVNRDRFSGVAHITRKYSGKIFEIDEVTVRELERYISPRFDRSQRVTADMPTWDKPLDTIELCLERLHTPRFAFDREQHAQAVRFLVDHREELDEEVEVRIPSMPENGFAQTDDPAWQYIIDNTTSNCGCGVHRTITPTGKPGDFKPDATRAAILSAAEPLYLVPQGRELERAVLKVEIVEQAGKHLFTFLDRPFSSVFNFVSLLSPKGYELGVLADSMTKSAHKPQLRSGKNERLYCEIDQIDPRAGTVTLVPDTGLVFMKK